MKKNSYWSKMTAQERSEEISRRRAKTKVYNHPGGAFRDPEAARQASNKRWKKNEAGNTGPSPAQKEL